MTRSRALPSGAPGPGAATYYAQRAGAAFIITEGTQPNRVGQGYPGTPGLHSDEQVRAWREVTAAVHDHGGRIWVQLMHAGRIVHPDLSDLTGLSPLAPSAIRPAGAVSADGGRRPYRTPQPMTRSEVASTIRDFAWAGERAVEAGFDGVELHAANGYLLHQFLASTVNRRQDDYGTDRPRFVLEVAAAVTAAVGADRVGLRISPGSTLNDLTEPDLEATYSNLLTRLTPLGLSYLHLTGVDIDTATALLVRRSWAGTLMVAPGSGGSPAADGGRDAALAWLERGADLIAFGRAFLANPDLPERFRRDLPLAVPDPATYYYGGDNGYLDYGPAVRPGGV